MSNVKDDPLIPVGSIRKPHGIRGELSFTFTAEDVTLLEGEVFLLPPKARVDRQLAQKHSVERVRAHHGVQIISFKGIATRNDAELLRQYTLFVPKSRLVPLDEDEVYLLDLPGLEVRVVDEETGNERVIGTLSSVDIPSGQELWTITTPEGVEILFPAVDDFIVDIDMDAQVACIAPPPGLLELYLNKE